jgi:transcriptional regulator
MYIPKHFEEHDLHEVAALIREFSFATLVSIVDSLPWATHIPLQLEIDEEGQWKLHGHIARANPQWRNFENKPDVLAIFMGPHSYISPSWYDQKNVPTWNYRAVHTYGKVNIIEGETLSDMLRKLMHRYETAHVEKPLAFDEIPKDVLEKDLRGLVGFEIVIDKLEAVSKLSQNRNEASYSNVINELKKLDAYDAKRIAEEMERKTPKTPKGGLNTSDAISDAKHSMFFGSPPVIFENAKKLRENLTFAEEKLWSFLREKQLGVKFRIQHPISRFIADFYCHELKLVIELDGGIHEKEENKELDKNRDGEMKELGLKILRFTNQDVIENIQDVLLTIKKEIPPK